MASNLNNGVILGYMRCAHADSVAVAGGRVFNSPSGETVVQCGGEPGSAQQPRCESGAQAYVVGSTDQSLTTSATKEMMSMVAEVVRLWSSALGSGILGSRGRGTLEAVGFLERDF